MIGNIAVAHQQESCVLGARIHLTIDDVISVALHQRIVELDPGTKKTLQVRRQEICTYLQKSNLPAYGFNRGFGHNVDVAVEPSVVAVLQQNLIRSHSAGVGPLVSTEIVRATMLLRAHSLAQGHSGVRPEVVEQLLTFLNADIVPAVYRCGSVGASGDLAPLSHVALALIGEGEVRFQGRLRPTAEVLRELGIAPLALEMKEGLALNNGVQFSNALGIIAVHELRMLLKTAVAATALSSQVMLGSDVAYLDELMRLRPHPGALVVAQWLRDLISGSPLREAHRPYEVDGEIQDPYNLRCAPQVLGACYDLIEEAAVTFEREVNSVTDNPLLLANPDDHQRYTAIVSGGHFHGMPIAVKLYNLVQAIGIIARLSNMRCVRFVDQARNKGLGSDLIWPELSEQERSVSSGMMIPEYVSASLTNELWGMAMPSHLFSLSTDAGQEDHVSMSATLGTRVHDMLPRLADLLAIELAFAHQGAAIRRVLPVIPSKYRTPTAPEEVEDEIRVLEARLSAAIADSRFAARLTLNFDYRVEEQERKLSSSSEAVLQIIGRYFPTVRKDRELSRELRDLSSAVARGEIVGAVPEKLWTFAPTR